MTQAEFGVVGLGVMGSNLALNLISHGVTTAGWNRDPKPAERARQASDGQLVVHSTLEGLVQGLATPRRILLMVKAGTPVDEVANRLQPLLEPGDVVIDGGNSWYRDTMRREADWSAHNLHWVGMGVSGGEEGARLGPSLMPGGSAEAYQLLAPTLEAIAARSEAGPCVTHVGPNGAGHFVKMVHNGIEYADMQMIAEAYDLLRRAGGLSIEDTQRVFAAWNRGPLQSFLIEITAEILGVKDADGTPLVERVLDRAGQKGTGRWTVQEALELGVPVPSITAAVDARILSSMKQQRVAAEAVLRVPPAGSVPPEGWVQHVHDALLTAKIAAYAQGMALIAEGSKHYRWGVNLAEVARIWKAGCIIRARFLDQVRTAFEEKADLPNLMLANSVRSSLLEHHAALRRAVATAASAGVPVPGLGSALSYFDSYRTAQLPQNLTQAQRDAFGAHTYQRTDDPEGPAHHTAWLNGAS